LQVIVTVQKKCVFDWSFVRGSQGLQKETYSHFACFCLDLQLITDHCPTPNDPYICQLEGGPLLPSSEAGHTLPPFVALDTLSNCSLSTVSGAV